MLASFRNVWMPRLVLVVLAALAAGCSQSGQNGSETHWVERCPEGCPGGTRCVEGTCVAASPLTCDLTGTWVTYLDVGVAWSSPVVFEGAGRVHQWTLTRRRTTSEGVIDEVRSCGIGSASAPLGSVWYMTREFPQLGISDEWQGVTFNPALFDDGLLPEEDVAVTLESGDPLALSVSDRLTTGLVRLQHGTEGVPSEAWNLLAELGPYLRDHDSDGRPGLTGLAVQGPVPGLQDTVFQDFRVDLLDEPPVRASALDLAIRTSARLEVSLTSCDPPRFEGFVLGGTWALEMRGVGCSLSGTDEPCSEEQIATIDANLLQLEHNGTSRVVSVKVPDGTTCEEARELSE